MGLVGGGATTEVVEQDGRIDTSVYVDKRSRDRNGLVDTVGNEKG